MKRTLYRCYDKDFLLLYVGSSLFFQQRIVGLPKNKWFDSVAYITLHSFRSKTTMLAAERDAIQLEKPKFNLMCTPKLGPHKKKLMALKASIAADQLKADKVKK